MNSQNLPKSIKSLSEDDRPREKMLLKGKEALSSAELIAILIGSGTRQLNAVQLSQLILQNCGNDLNKLATLSIPELIKFPGIGPAKAVTIAAALELGRRKKDSAVKTYTITSSNDCYQVLEPHLADLVTEQFWVIYLNRGNRILGKKMMTQGGIAGTVVDKRVILKEALEHQASGLVLAHNHPSGNLQPSKLDRELTKSLQAAAKLMEMKVIDHIIITQGGYFSFADEGLL